jgi:hypothetical protein
MDRIIRATFDDAGVIVYQAFKSSIADEALRLGTFGRGFNLQRMTWIKSSFGWMLYRSCYATKHRQDRILKIKLSHEGFQAILSQGVPTAYDPGLFKSEEAWRSELDRSEVRYQWDPDRDVLLHRLDRRALQIGIRGSIVKHYVNHWIHSIEDATQLAHAIKESVEHRRRELPVVPEEREYNLDDAIQRILGMTRR